MGRRKKRKDKDDIEETKSFSATKLNLTTETKRGIAVVVFIVLGGVTGLSVIGAAGMLGQFIFKTFMIMFGVMGYLVPILFLLIAWILFQNKIRDEENPHPYFRTYLGMFLIAGGLAGLIHSIYLDDTATAISLANDGRAGGYLGALFAGPLVGAFGFWAGDLLMLGVLAIGILIAFDINPLKWFKKETT